MSKRPPPERVRRVDEGAKRAYREALRTAYPSTLGTDNSACDECGEWDLVGSGHEPGESCPDGDR